MNSLMIFNIQIPCPTETKRDLNNHVNYLCLYFQNNHQKRKSDKKIINSVFTVITCNAKFCVVSQRHKLLKSVWSKYKCAKMRRGNSGYIEH